MKLDMFTKLYERIQLEPSILLLGQNYLSMGGEKDPIWQKLVEGPYASLNLPRRKANYPLLWEKTVETAADANRVMADIAAAGQGDWHNQAVDVIKNLRWSLIYTSAIDGSDALVRNQGCTPVPQDERTGRPQYLNKDRNYRVDLCGDRQTPPVLTGKIERKTFRQSIANKIAWIGNTYLEYYGLLVIDGLDPECDWLDDDLLFEQMYQMQPNSVYWFGAPDELGENAELLIERGILHVEEDGFYEHMRMHMPEMLERDSDIVGTESDDALYTSLSLRLKSGTHTVRISRADISAINGTNLCVIDDETMQATMRTDRPRAVSMADFLMQNGLPSWRLFNAPAGETPFYIPRDCDEELLELVSTALKREVSTDRKPVLLYGPSNSGKSMTLANLALTIAKKRAYPVIYIRGELLPGAEKKLEEFIKNWFSADERYSGEHVERVLVVWDGSGLKRSERDYIDLQKKHLFTANAIVVGSIYTEPSSSAIGVELPQDLSSQEKNGLRNVLRSLGNSYYADRFDEIQKYSRPGNNLPGNNSLLYLLQTLFKYEFDAEYKALHDILSKQFKDEKNYIEQTTENDLSEYVKEFYATQEQAAKSGAGSSFQEALRMLLQQSDERQKQAQTPDEKDAAAANAEKLGKFKQLSSCIEKVNNILAVASQFDVRLPLKLLLRFLRDENGVSMVYSMETIKLIDILRRDAFISFERISRDRFGECDFVRFRNAIEAENHICLVCDLPLGDSSEVRKEAEVNWLKEIIEAAVGEQELRSVIELIRQFGPNGHGKLSEQDTSGNRRGRGDYTAYKDYWIPIVEKLIEQFPDDPEATLVYAHFVRETIRQQEDGHKTYFEAYHKQASTRLEAMLGRMEGESGQQYARLSVELCANYQQDMHDNGYDPVKYREIISRVRRAFLMGHGEAGGEIRRDFSNNSMLDILLNAYDSYCAHIDAQSNAADDSNELAEMVGYIDEMLDLDGLIYESRTSMINKIKTVYDRLRDEGEQLAKLEQNLVRRNSDAFLYLQARMLWQSEEIALPDQFKNDTAMSICYKDRYMLLCSDFPSTAHIPTPQLLAQARKDAEQVVALLEKQAEMVRKTQSERCVMMLLRAKWFLRTGNVLLAEKQRVALTRDEWSSLIALCDQYLAYHETQQRESFIPAYFFKGIYEWIYGNTRTAVDYFNDAKSLVRTDRRLTSINRFVLCKEGTVTPRSFQVTVQRSMEGKFTAQIRNEIGDAASAAVGRYGMGVSDRVLKYLFDGNVPRESQRQAYKDAIVQFNLIGAQMDVPFGGVGDE